MSYSNDLNDLREDFDLNIPDLTSDVIHPICYGDKLIFHGNARTWVVVDIYTHTYTPKLVDIPFPSAMEGVVYWENPKPVVVGSYCYAIGYKGDTTYLFHFSLDSLIDPENHHISGGSSNEISYPEYKHKKIDTITAFENKIFVFFKNYTYAPIDLTTDTQGPFNYNYGKLMYRTEGEWVNTYCVRNKIYTFTSSDLSDEPGLRTFIYDPETKTIRENTSIGWYIESQNPRIRPSSGGVIHPGTILILSKNKIYVLTGIGDPNFPTVFNEIYV